MRNDTDRSSQLRDRLFQPASMVLPVAFCFVTCGIAGWFGKVDIASFVVMLLSAICLQLTSNMAKSLGDMVDIERARKEYYERKFARFKLEHGKFDPIAGTAGDLLMMQSKNMLIASAAVTLVMGYGLISLCFSLDSWNAKWVAFAVFILIEALVILRYLGAWRYGYRPYGNAIVFILVTASVIGGFYLLTHTFMLGTLYPAAGFGSLAAAMGNINDICSMEDDNEFSLHENPRRTLPLAASINAGFAFHAISMVLAMVWLAAFPLVMGAVNIWNYAFVLFYIPAVRDIFSMRKAKPSDMGRIRISFIVSMGLICIAFFFCLAAANLWL